MGDERLVWGEVRNGGGKEEGASPWGSQGVTRTKSHSCAQGPEHACSQPLLPGPHAPSQDALQDPRGGFGGTQLQNRSLWPHDPRPSPASSPLLGPGSRKVLGWADRWKQY